MTWIKDFIIRVLILFLDGIIHLHIKDITLSALAYARVGQWIQYDFNTAYKPTEQDGSPAVDFWTPENQGAKFPRPGIASQNDMPALAFEKASFFKIREITLGYTFPKNTD